jgi:hypothetical protein
MLLEISNLIALKPQKLDSLKPQSPETLISGHLKTLNTQEHLFLENQEFYNLNERMKI